MLESALGWAISSVGERFLHTEEATGSIPVSPTILLHFPSPSDQSGRNMLYSGYFLDRSGLVS